MLNSRNSVLVAVALLVVGVASTAYADVFTTSPLPPGRYVTDLTPEPLAPQSITQSNDTSTVVTGTSVHCPTAPGTTWYRLFDLDGDHALTGQFCVEDVDYGIESLAAAQNLTISVHCLTEGMAFLNANLVLQGSAVVPHTPTSLTLHNAAVAGCCDADTEDLAIELTTQAPGFFVGCNNLGQTAPTFIESASCGLPEPGDLAGIGFPNSHLLLVVNGDGEGGQGDGGGDGGGVPASTDLGMLLMVLALLGSSAYFLRRKATN
jgi:hypothetical protein